MTQEQRQELLDLLEHEKHGNLYDFIVNNYYSLSKEDLKDLCKEAFALLYEHKEQENVKNGKEYDHFLDLHKEYLETLKENTNLLEND